MPIPVAERSKARVCRRSLAGVAGANPAEGLDVCLLCVLYSKDKKAKPGQLGQRSSTDEVQTAKEIPSAVTGDFFPKLPT